MTGETSKGQLQAGLSALQAGRPDEAVALLEAAVAAAPGDTDAMQLLGVALHKAGRSDEGVAWMERAIARNRRNPDYLINLANVRRDRREFAEAERLLRQAVALAPRYAKGWHVLASTLRSQEKMLEAVECRGRAHELEPNSAMSLTRLGIAQVEARDLAAGLATYRRAVALSPRDIVARSNVALVMHYPVDSAPAEIFAEHQRAGDVLMAGHQPCQPHPNRPDPERCLRVGYVSPDLRQHSVGFFVEPLFAHHDSSRVEVVAYADVGRPDAMTERLRAHTALWRDVRGYGDAALHDLIRRDGIDVLVDLAGHTAGNRLAVFARKPAPVQVTWLGYPDTTGLPTMDARLVDAITDPPGAEAYATERLIRLPHGFLCYGASPDAPEVSALPAGTDQPITFGSFNNLPKLTDAVFDLWARVLAAVPKSRLQIKARGLGDPRIRAPILDIFARHGVAADRLSLFGRTRTYREHMALYGQMDLALDSFPYNGTTTTCEALWMGVPVVTLKGDRHCARVGESLLTQVGLRELIAQTPDDFVAVAANLARDRARLAGLRASMRERMRASPLMDAAGFARRVEAAYRELWRDWCVRAGA